MAIYQDHTDLQLAALLRNSDHAAFSEIYDRYWAVLYLHARKLLNNDEEARDVVQELFTTLWKKSGQIEFNVQLSSYLYKAIRNRIFKHIGRQKLVHDYQQSLADFINEGHIDTDTLVRERELSRLIEQQIQALPPKMREVFELSRKQHLSHKEISEKLGISEHTVKRQVSNALGILRDKLGISASLLCILLGYKG
ncbi:RNA polymerase sigma-70 factor [Pedobacter frigidisoli]|uniref:RNA polymerase sigma-70 factor n=1 Tax=Pedobacter frigidisoli TaxID=2530455 RepID=UPI00292FA351|nr:RNA polymerase sigma-70 factor [Pedobacter frigidisoli]